MALLYFLIVVSLKASEIASNSTNYNDLCPLNYRNLHSSITLAWLVMLFKV